MLTPLFKKSKHVGIVEFLATLAFGFVGLNIVLLEDFPKSFVWLFSPLCQCSFLIGIAQVGILLPGAIEIILNHLIILFFN